MQAYLFLADLSSPTADSAVSLWLTKHGAFKLTFLIFSRTFCCGLRGSYRHVACRRYSNNNLHCCGPVDGLGLICTGKQLQNQPGHEFRIQ